MAVSETRGGGIAHILDLGPAGGTGSTQLETQDLAPRKTRIAMAVVVTTITSTRQQRFDAMSNALALLLEQSCTVVSVLCVES